MSELEKKAEKVKLSKNEVKKLIDLGWKKPQLAEHFGLNLAQMTKALKRMDLKIRKFKEDDFVIVEDEEVTQITQNNSQNLDELVKEDFIFNGGIDKEVNLEENTIEEDTENFLM